MWSKWFWTVELLQHDSTWQFIKIKRNTNPNSHLFSYILFNFDIISCYLRLFLSRSPTIFVFFFVWEFYSNVHICSNRRKIITNAQVLFFLSDPHRNKIQNKNQFLIILMNMEKNVFLFLLFSTFLFFRYERKKGKNMLRQNH